MKPLSRKIRTASLILMFFIFIIVGPILLVQAMGYRLDQVKDVFTIVKTGGIYIQSDISGTNVYVNDEFVKKNGLFLRNILIEDLDPDMSHKIVIMKEGFHTWTKELPVYESLVTEVRIMMLPNEIQDREIYPYIDIEGKGTIEEPVDETVLMNKEYEELLEYFTPVEELEEDAKENIFDTDSLEEEIVVKDIPEYFVDLGISDPEELDNLVTLGSEVSWLEDGNVIINWIGRETSAPYYYCLFKENCRDTIILDWEDDIISFDFFPGRSDILIVSIESGIYAVEVDDRSERNTQPIYVGEDLEWIKTTKDRIVVKDGDIFHELHF